MPQIHLFLLLKRTLSPKAEDSLSKCKCTWRGDGNLLFPFLKQGWVTAKPQTDWQPLSCYLSGDLPNVRSLILTHGQDADWLGSSMTLGIVHHIINQPFCWWVSSCSSLRSSRCWKELLQCVVGKSGCSPLGIGQPPSFHPSRGPRFGLV